MKIFHWKILWPKTIHIRIVHVFSLNLYNKFSWKGPCHSITEIESIRFTDRRTDGQNDGRRAKRDQKNSLSFQLLWAKKTTCSSLVSQFFSIVFLFRLWILTFSRCTAVAALSIQNKIHWFYIFIKYIFIYFIIVSGHQFSRI